MSYQNSKIYKLINTTTKEIYIGSTTRPLNIRLNEHKSLYTTGKTKKEIRELIQSSKNGYLSPDRTRELLTLADINFVNQFDASTETEIQKLSKTLKFPVVMKVVGPLHKSDIGGVVLNIQNESELLNSFKRLIKIKDSASNQNSFWNQQTHVAIYDNVIIR